MVKDRILKPCANAFLTPIYPAYSPKNFIFALRRSVSELVLGHQSTTKFFNCFQIWIFHFWGNFHLFFFLKKFQFLVLLPKFHCLFVILVHFWVKIAFWAFSVHLLCYSFTFLLRFQVVAKRFKIFQIRSNEISWKFEKKHH